MRALPEIEHATEFLSTVEKEELHCFFTHIDSADSEACCELADSVSADYKWRFGAYCRR